MHTKIHAHTHTIQTNFLECEHTHILTYIHTYIHSYIHTRMQTYILHAYIHHCKLRFKQSHIHTNKKTCACEHLLYTYIRTYIHTYVHTYIHRQIVTFSRKFILTCIYGRAYIDAHTYMHACTCIQASMHTYLDR